MTLPSTPSQPALHSSAQEVSWQTAFFAVLSAAAPVLIQHAGGPLGSPYAYRVGLRLSPLFCLLDTLWTFAQWLRLLHAGCPPRTAARHVWTDRFPPAERADAAHRTALWGVGLGAFAVTNLTQTVKACGYVGVPLTRAVVVVYLLAFLAAEGFRWVAAGAAPQMPVSRRVDAARSEMARVEGYLFPLALGAQEVARVVLVAAMVPDEYFLPLPEALPRRGDWDLKTGRSFVYLYLLGLGLGFALLWLTIYGISMLLGPADKVARKPERSVAAAASSEVITGAELRKLIGEAGLQVILSMTASVVILFLFPLGIAHAAEVLSDRFTPQLLPVLKICYVFWKGMYVGLVIVLLLAPILILEQTGKVSFQKFLTKLFFPLLILVMNFGTLLGYYLYIYSSEGTYKSEWTEKLG